MTITMTCTCAGLPGKPCKTVFLAEVGWVPPFEKIGKGRLTEQQILAAARCDRCARLYPAMVAGVRRMYRLPSALAQVRKSSPTTSLGELLQTSSIRQESSQRAAEQAAVEKALWRKRRNEQNERLNAAVRQASLVA
jgi:hypothetical protein